MQTYLLIGGAGFLGTNISLELSKNLNNRIIIIDKILRKELIDVSNIINYKKDVNDEKSLKLVFEKHKIDVVIYLHMNILPLESGFDETKLIEENINVLEKVFKWLKKSNVSKIIYFSSGGAVYGESQSKIEETVELKPKSLYGKVKKISEEYVKMESKNSDINFLILRPSNPYGKYQNIYGKQGIIAVSFGKVMNNEVLEIYGDGEAIKDYIYMQDFNYLFSKLLEKEIWNEVLNLGSGKGENLKSIIKTIEKVTSEKIKTKYKNYNVNDIKVNVLENKKLLKLIGEDKYEFVSLEKGIKMFWNDVIGENNENI